MPSDLVGDLAVDGEVEAHLLGLRLDAEPEDQVDDLDDDERGDDRVGDRGADRDELDDDLAAGCRRSGPSSAADGRGREDAGRDGAEHAADAVDREHVERVVDLEARAEERRAVADATGDEADDQGAAGGHEARRRGDGDEAGDGTARGTDDADLALVEVAARGPR